MIANVKLWVAIRHIAHGGITWWAVAVCALASGCASRADPAGGFTPRFGESAVIVARHVPRVLARPAERAAATKWRADGKQCCGRKRRDLPDRERTC
jgi:hypothetical protein